MGLASILLSGVRPSLKLAENSNIQRRAAENAEDALRKTAFIKTWKWKSDRYKAVWQFSANRLEAADP